MTTQPDPAEVAAEKIDAEYNNLYCDPNIIREAYAEQTAEEEIDEAVKSSMDERCDAYERRCTCVPVLRAEVKRLRGLTFTVEKET